MKPFALLALFLFLSPPAFAATHGLSERLAQLIPEGYSEGVTEKGAPCRLVFNSRSGPNPRQVEYARAQVIAEPEGNLIDVELFFQSGKGKTKGRWNASSAKAHHRQGTLSAKKTAKGVLVRAKNLLTGLSASCLIQR
jgi:hypothetical protein